MHKIKNKKYILPMILVILGLITRFAFIWHPAQVVFDEVHFGKFVSSYLTGQFYFDIHPPLGKLLIAIVAKLSGFDPGFSFKVIGEKFVDSKYIVLRSVPSMFGSLLPVCMYFFVRSLKGSYIAAFFCGITVVFENALLVQSHFIFVDSMLLFFGFSGITVFFWYRNISPKLKFIIFSGVLIGCSFSVKWTGLSFLGIVMAVCFWDYIRKKQSFPDAFRLCSILFLISIIVYMTVFAVHFSLLNKKGPGDDFMSPRFLKTLKGSKYEADASIHKLGYLGKFIELNKTMYLSNRNLKATHPNSSKYYTWPIMKRSVYYWVQQIKPLVWWSSFGFMIIAFFLWRPENYDTKLFLYFGWFINFLPFQFIGRVMFLYHYLPALLFSISIMSFFLFDGLRLSRRIKIYIFVVLILIYVAFFLYFSPLTYGLPLTDKQYEMRIWLKSWI